MKSPFFIIVIIGCIGVCTLCSWEVRYPKGHTKHQISLSSTSPPSVTKIKKPKDPPYDYGDRTQLSAFILCLFIGFLGGHQWYMQNYAVASIQLGLFLLVVLLVLSQGIAGAVFGFLFGLTLVGWVIIDLMLIAYNAIRPKSRRTLIPWENTIEDEE